MAAEDAEEKIFSLEEETYHSTELSDILQKLKQNPLNINTASKNDLLQLPWLSEQDIDLIISFREKTEIISSKQLAEIGIDEITISDISDYIIFAAKEKVKIQNQTRVEFNEAKEDYPSTAKYFQRTKAEYGKFQAGFLSQKDEGETDPVDFYSYYMQYQNSGFLQNLVLGKFRIALGQGLVFAPKLGMSKSAAATSVPVKRYNSIKPYTSSFEIWDLQGIAGELKLSKFRIIPFVSVNDFSANLDSTKAITSFNETGFHFDESKKNNVQEKLFGTAIQYEKESFEIGTGFSRFNFDHDFADSSNSGYSAGNLYFMINNNGYPIFAEAALIDDKFGALAGMKFGENKLRQLLVFRWYQKDIPTWHGNAFSSQSNFDNETGLYYGITIIPAKRNKINAYFDVWSFPKTRYFEKMPTVGSEQFLQWESHFSTQSIRLTLQHKFKEKYISLDEAKIRDYERTLIRFDWWQKLHDFTFKTRGEFVSEYLAEEKVYTSGFLFYEQLKLKLEKLELIGQLTFYKSDTSPFKVKHYVYENNVDGIMQNSVVSGDGINSYLLAKYHISSNFEIQMKISDVWQQPEKLRAFAQIICNW
ncbi:MAG: helix-hairpin-helix domain-containing protein [Candidatus Cloacimonetes bacterium]|nr:helix-hairpin-helix domain-containing protein [Candidatus Cloacimonadota bacterium]